MTMTQHPFRSFESVFVLSSVVRERLACEREEVATADRRFAGWQRRQEPQRMRTAETTIARAEVEIATLEARLRA